MVEPDALHPAPRLDTIPAPCRSRDGSRNAQRHLLLFDGKPSKWIIKASSARRSPCELATDNGSYRPSLRMIWEAMENATGVGRLVKKSRRSSFSDAPGEFGH
jgi:hypothetical protein